MNVFQWWSEMKKKKKSIPCKEKYYLIIRFIFGMLFLSLKNGFGNLQFHLLQLKRDVCMYRREGTCERSEV